MWLSETKLALHIGRVKCQAQSSRFGKISDKKVFVRSACTCSDRRFVLKVRRQLRMQNLGSGWEPVVKNLKFHKRSNGRWQIEATARCSRRSLSLKFIELICIPAMASASLELQAINEEKVFSTVQQIWQAITDCSKLCAYTKDSHIDSLLAYESAQTRLTVVCTALGFRRQKFSNDIERQTFLIKYLTLGTGLRRSGRR